MTPLANTQRYTLHPAPYARHPTPSILKSLSARNVNEPKRACGEHLYHFCCVYICIRLVFVYHFYLYKPKRACGQQAQNLIVPQETTHSLPAFAPLREQRSEVPGKEAASAAGHVAWRCARQVWFWHVVVASYTCEKQTSRRRSSHLTCRCEDGSSRSRSRGSPCTHGEMAQSCTWAVAHTCWCASMPVARPRRLLTSRAPWSLCCSPHNRCHARLPCRRDFLSSKCI